MSLSSYKMFVAPGAPDWLSTQQLFDVMSTLIAPSSTQTFQVNIPSCMTQIDGWYGQAPTNLLDSNPYGYPNVPNVLTWAYTATPLCVTIPSADLSITKTVDDSTPHEGDTVNYAVTVSDLGPANAAGVVTTDVLPSGLTFESATTSVGNYASSTGTWTIGNLAASSTATLNIAALVNSGTAGTTITNTAMVSANASTTDSNSANNSASASITVQANSNCTLSASDFENDVHNGSISFTGIGLASSTGTFTLTNHTSCSAPISLSSYKMFVAPGAPDWLSTQQLVDVASSSVAANSSTTLTVTLPSCMAQVDAWYGEAPTNFLDSNLYGFPNVPFVLTSIFSPASLCVTTPTSTPSADISIVKTVDNATPHEGDTVNYTLAVSALGPATSTGVTATDVLPSGLTFENATASIGSYASSTGVWTIGDMSASSTAQLMIAALVDSGTAGTTIDNTAVVSESASSTDNNPSNNSSTVPITVQTNGCTSNCGGGGGTPATSTLTINVSGLNASDTASLSIADLTASTTQATSTGNGSSTFVLPTNDNYAVAATTTAPNYSVATSSGCAGTLSAAATCNVVFTLATTTTPSTDADISIVKTVDNATPNPGDTVNYTITVTALGPATSSIVSAQDQLPIGLSLVSASTSVGTYDMSTGNWTIGTLSPNATATLLIAAQVGSNEAGQTITNTATVSQLSSLVDPNPSNNSSSVSIAVQSPGGGGCTSNCGGGGGGIPTAEIGITKSVDNATPNPGDTIHYTLTIQAIGPNSSVGVVATDTLPAGVTFVSASSSAGTYASSTGTWTLGTIAPNANPTLVITALVNSADSIGQSITNTATVGESTSVNDPLTGNNTASATITVGGSNGSGSGGGGGGGGSGGTIGVSNGGGTIVGGGGGSTGGGEVLGASASCGIYLDQYIHPIRQDLNNPVEVDKLQTFLNMNLGTTLPITGYYGPETIAAVDQFQVKYHIEVLRPWLNYGLPTEYTPTDYVYKTTQRWINLIMCSSLNLPIPQLP